MAKIIQEKQDLTYLEWSHIRSSSGTAGTFLKASSSVGGVKKYYKLSDFDPAKGVIGHECINEIIVDRLLTILNVDHLEYELINADIQIDNTVYSTYLCSSVDFKKRGEAKLALDDYYREHSAPHETPYAFCAGQGWEDYINNMIVIDYLIMNRDRHGANIEVLRNARAHTLRIAPLFDHGISLLYSCKTDAEAIAFDIAADKPCNNFIGSRSCYENLFLLPSGIKLFEDMLRPEHKEIIFEGLDGIISKVFIDRIWEMIYTRYQIYENL